MKNLYLFVCVENACRSQMAQGLFNHLTDQAKAASAGTSPSGSINPMAIQVMGQIGIDISTQTSKPLTPEMVSEARRVITMGCIDECPYAPPEKIIQWNIPDPKGKDRDFFVHVRDMIEQKIVELIRKDFG